ncbi:uncharacterized protein LOC131857624 [Cryptomeria japonica]|uniref:uncharacterized protein LOC131857624 n=1 Tax=Cryptomeria japonica TaxID=3369 RepID=UPI0027DA647B|nr:uncharacterized protein LOC131857624 [Cryptomeria japonica]
MTKEKVEKIKLFKDGEVLGGSFDGAFGGITIFWNLRQISGEPVKQDSNLAFISIHHIGDGTSFLLTNIYAPNNRLGRSKFWKKMEAIWALYKDDMWIVMGEFNTPLRDNEKFGGVPSQLDSRIDLLNFINNQVLHDIDLRGANFTWMIKRMGEDLIQIKLDRALISNEWMWLDHPNLEKAIEMWWSIDVKGNIMYRMAKTLRYTKDNIKKCNKEVFGDLFAAKSKTQLELKEMQDKIQTSGYNEESIREEN